MTQPQAATALQLYTGDEQERLTLLKDYRPQDHIASWSANDRGRNRTVNYYPAAWRLYELSLRYPFANFSSEIVHKDAEKNFVVVRVRLYLGPSYDDSPKKAEAHKQGPLTELDKVETKAKARAARDFGIGTEHALDMDDAEADAVNDTPPAVASSGSSRKVVEADKPLANGNGSPVVVGKPIYSLMETKEFFLTYFKPTQWRGFKASELGMEVEDSGLTDEELATLWKRLTVIDEDAKARAGAQVAAAN